MSTAASVSKTGYSVFKAGKLNAVEMVPFDAMRDASYRAVEDLSLTIVREKSGGEGHFVLSLRDDRGDFIGIYLLERTRTMTRVRIDVGLFGSEAVARLVLRRINAALVESGHLDPPNGRV